MSDHCHKCKKEYDRSKLIVNISDVPGYSTQTYKCSCGHEQFHCVPRSKEKQKFWENMFK